MSRSFPSTSKALYEKEGPSTRVAPSKSNVRSSTATLKQVNHSDFCERPGSPITPPRNAPQRVLRKRKRRSTSSPPLGRDETPKELKRSPSLGGHSFGRSYNRAFSPLRLLPATDPNPALEAHDAYDASDEGESADAPQILSSPQDVPAEPNEIESNESSISQESHPWEHSRQILEKDREGSSTNHASRFSAPLASPPIHQASPQTSRDPWSSSDDSGQVNQATPEHLVVNPNSSADRAIEALLASPAQLTKRKPVASTAAPIPTNVPPNWAFTLPRFVVGDVFLGKGAYGLVHEGQDKLNKKIVAIKAIPCGQHKQPSLADALREILIHRLATEDDSGARHKNIVAFLGSIETPDICCTFGPTSSI